MEWLYLVLGIVMISAGADWLVKGCVRLSTHLRVSAFAISALVIGIGSNIPEIVIVLMSAGKSLEPTILPQVISGVMINVLGIVGICAVIRPIKVGAVPRQEIIMLMVAAAAMMIMLLDRELNLIDGIALLVMFAYYIWATRSGHTNHKNIVKTRDGMISIIVLVFGIAMLYAGSELFMGQLQKLVSMYNLGGELVGSLIIAPGTAGPELVVSILALFRRQPQVLIGNIVGSCIAHILLIGGVAGIVALPSAESFGAILMFLAVIVFIIDILRHKIGRGNGMIYLVMLFLYFSSVLL